MTLYVSGDTALSTWSLLSGRPMARPPTHDLLWQVCQQASRWSFMHAAVVESRDGVLMGRLFFGGLCWLIREVRGELAGCGAGAWPGKRWLMTVD